MSSKKRPRGGSDQKGSSSDQESQRDSKKDCVEGDDAQTLFLSSDSFQPSIDVVNIHKISANDFFHQYVAKRRPCVIDAMFDGEKQEKLTIEKIKEAAADCVVEVEKRADPKGNFGQNRTKGFTMKMTVREFLEKLDSPVEKELFYLSTQQGSIQEEFIGKLIGGCGVSSNFSPLSGNLKLESINLWMGGAGNKNGSSSGLHHDFHDNFYILHSGMKKFVLHPPTTAIPVYGDIQTIHPNGLISYKRKPTRADGVPLEALREANDKNENSESSEDEDGEEFVIGKGADYDSSSEDDRECDFKNALRNGSAQCNLSDDDFEEEEDSALENSNQQIRPDHFSPINLASADMNCLKSDPVMGKLNPQILSLQAGQGLYLPASWFHCVFSFTNQDSVHTAVNYWFHPPDNLTNYEHPYMDSQFWNPGKKA